MKPKKSKQEKVEPLRLTEKSKSQLPSGRGPLTKRKEDKANK